MFIEEFYNTQQGKKFDKVSRNATTYPYMFKYWREKLFERAMRIFVWEDTGDLPPKEIELRLLIAGKVAITEIPNNTILKKFKNSQTAMFMSFHDPSEYQDEWHKCTVRCPIYAGERTIGKDCIVISNNSLRNSLMPLIDHYAALLAHCNTSLVNLLINARDSGGVPIISSEKQKTEIDTYYSRLYNGQYGSVLDKGMLGIEYLGIQRGTDQSIRDVHEVETSLIKAFYADIGIRDTFEKKNNSVVAEITGDTSLLRQNLSDMLENRKLGAKDWNNLYGTSARVHVSEEIDYDLTEHTMDETTDVQAENTTVEVGEE